MIDASEHPVVVPIVEHPPGNGEAGQAQVVVPHIALLAYTGGDQFSVTVAVQVADGRGTRGGKRASGFLLGAEAACSVLVRIPDQAVRELLCYGDIDGAIAVEVRSYKVRGRSDTGADIVQHGVERTSEVALPG